MAKSGSNIRFNETDSVSDLIEADYDILPVLSRFSLPLGFGDATIAELCGRAGISTDLFVLVVNFILTGEIDSERLARADAVGVADFLLRSHDYYLAYKFPHIRANLIAALDPIHADVNPVIAKYFDDYIGSVKEHFAYEEHVLFPYVRALAGGVCPEEGNFSADLFARQHDHDVESKLSELKNIILRYYSTSVPYRMYDALVDIYNCEADLTLHSEVEERILVPLLRALEERYRGQN